MEKNQSYKAYLNFCDMALRHMSNQFEKILSDNETLMSIDKIKLMFARDKIQEASDFLMRSIYEK